MKQRLKEYKRIQEDLFRQIDLSEQYKAKIKETVEILQRRYESGSIDKETYFSKLNEFLEGKSPEEWYSIYDNHIIECKKCLREYTNEITSLLDKDRGLFSKTLIFVSFFLALSLIFLGLKGFDAETAGLAVYEKVENEIAESKSQQDIYQEKLKEIVSKKNKTIKKGVTADNITIEDNLTNITLEEIIYNGTLIVFDESNNIILSSVVEEDNKTIIYTGVDYLSRIEILDLNGTKLGISNVSRNIIEPENISFVKIYSVDSSNLTFSRAVLYSRAVGNVLYSCGIWDFEMSLCLGSWEKIKSIVKDKEYSIKIESETRGFAEGINIREVNITIEENKTKELIQGKAEVNKKIKWIKKIKLDKSERNLKIKLHPKISNIKVKRIVDEVESEISEEKLKLKEKEEETELTIEEEMKDGEVEYYTEAPAIIEEEISSSVKQITISSDIGYTDILAYTNVTEATSDKIKLYWLVNETRNLVTDVGYNDTNENGLIDRIEWIVPHLSNQTYEVVVELGSAHADYNESMVLWMQFGDEDNSTHAIDSSGKGNHGELMGGVTKVYEHYEFNGDGDYVLINYGDSLNVTNNFSISLWFNTNSVTTSQQKVLTKGYGANCGGTGAWEYGYYIEVQDDDIIWSLANNTGKETATISNQLSTNTWHHFVATYNGTDIAFFKDGSLQISDHIEGGVCSDAQGENIAIASRPQNPTHYFNGSIDEVIIYNRSLNSTEILAIYNKGLYNVTGTYTSSIFDAGDVVNWSHLAITMDEPDDTNITFETRSINNSKPNMSDDNLVATWSLNETDLCNDTHLRFSSTPNGGISCSLASGRFIGENATEFDGEGDYVSVTYSNPSLNFSGNDNITVSMWVYPLDQIGQAGNEGWLLDQSSEIILRFDDDNDFAQFILNSFSLNDRAQTANNAVTKNQWNLLTGTYNGSDLCIYVDAGTPACVQPTGTYGGATGNFLIGSHATTNHFNGSLAYVAIYNRSLSQSEILQLGSWQACTLDSSHEFCNIASEDSRYLQWKADLCTYGPPNNVTPALSIVDLSYDIDEAITIDKPENGTYNDTTVPLNVSSNEAVSVWWYSLNSEANASFTPNTTFTAAEGNNTIIIYANFSTKNVTWTQINFSVDTTYPTVNFTGKTLENDTHTGVDSVIVNLSSNDTDGNGDINDHYSFVDFDDSLVLWMRMDDVNGSGDPVDSSGYGNDGGSEADAKQTDAGYYGKGFEFDGADDYIDVGDDSSLNITGNLTVSAWIYRTEDTTGEEMYVIDKGLKGAYALSVYSTNDKMYFYINSSGSVYCNGGTINVNTWHYLTGVYNGSDILCYVDGIEVDTTSYLGGMVRTTASLRIGVDTGGTASRYINGSIDEVMVFNRSLSAEEVVSLYNQTSYYHNFTDLSEGSHTFKGYAVDRAGNKKETEERNITVDLTYPWINFTGQTPMNGSSQAGDSIYVNLTTSDTNEQYSFVDFDNDLVLWMRMDDVNDTGHPVDISKHCYDNETEILTDDGWKLFEDLTREEKIATLNQEIGKVEWQKPTEYQEFEHDDEMYKIGLEDGSNLLVSEKHKVYVTNHDTLDLTSEVTSDSTSSIFSNLFSYDQNGHLYFNANAKYGASFLCSLSNSSALGNNEINSSIGTVLIFFSSNISNISSSNLDKLDLDNISSLCRLISINNLSGAIKSSLGKKIKSSSFPAIKEEITTLASITSNIYFNSSNFFLYALYNSSFTLLPIFNASFSESLDLATIDLNNANSAAVSDIAFLAISDQFISGIESISRFKSVGMANVSVGILYPPLAVNASNYVYYVQLYKPFDSEDLSDFELTEISDIYSEIEKGEASNLVFLDENLEEINVGKENENQISNNFLNFSVLNISTEDCFLKAGSLDQIGQFNFNARANIGSSLSCGDSFFALASNCLNNPSGIISMNFDNSDNASLNCSELSLEYFKTSDSFFFNSSIAYSGVNNATSIISEFTMINLTGFSLKNESNIFVSTTNCIFYQPAFLYFFHIPSLILSPSLRQSFSVNSEFSNSLSSFLSNNALLIFSAKNPRTDSEMFSSGSSSICSFNSLGIDNVMFGILSPPESINSVYSVKDVETYKSFGSEDLSDFELTEISDIYGEIGKGEASNLVFLDENLEEIKVKSIEKVQYKGKIYDVDVENDIVLVRRSLSSKETLGKEVGIWSGNSNNGTIGGNANLTDSGYYGRAFEFDDDGDYVDTSSITLGLNTTVSFWIKRFETGRTDIYSGGDYIGTPSYNNNIVTYFSNSSGDTASCWSGGDTIDANEWHHIARVTEDLSDGSVKIYINGVDRTADVSCDDEEGLSSITFDDIGEFASSYFNGTIDEVMVFNRSLSAEEIVSLYNQTSYAHNFTNLGVADHTFTGYTVDRAGNKNDTTEWTVTIDNDADGDNVPDNLDTLEGNTSDIATSGIGNLIVTIDGDAPNGTFNGSLNVVFYDGNVRFMNFTHNFSASNLNLSDISIKVDSYSIIADLNGQLLNGETKVLYLNDHNFGGLCVKDAEISSVSDISNGCNLANETNFTSCLGDAMGVTLNGITCYDQGDKIKVINLNHSGIKGIAVPGGRTKTPPTKLHRGNVEELEEEDKKKSVKEEIPKKVSERERTFFEREISDFVKKVITKKEVNYFVVSLLVILVILLTVFMCMKRKFRKKRKKRK